MTAHLEETGAKDTAPWDEFCLHCEEHSVAYRPGTGGCSQCDEEPADADTEPPTQPTVIREYKCGCGNEELHLLRKWKSRNDCGQVIQWRKTIECSECDGLGKVKMDCGTVTATGCLSHMEGSDR